MKPMMQNYHLVIEKELMRGKKNRTVFNAYCPVLGLSDWGESIPKAIANITKLIAFHIESLVALGYPVPKEEKVTKISTMISWPAGAIKSLARA